MNTTASERYLLQGSQPLPLPDLLDLQIKSFQWFCFEGLEELFRSSFPIVSADRKFELHYSNHKVYLPSKSVYECLEKDLNYEAKISGIFTLHDMNTFEVKEQEVFLGNIPFMTPEGTFVVNGVERIIVSQLVRSPGVNFTIIKEGFKLSRFKTNEIPYGVTFQANRGSWIKFEYDFKKRIYLAKIDNPRRQIKVPITIFLKALGFEVDRERRIITYPKAKLGYYLDKYLPNHNIDYKKAWKDQEMKFDSGLFNTLEIDYTNSQSEAQKEFWRKLHPTDPFSEDTLEQMLPGKYFDPRRFDIADVGRHTINNKLNIDIPKNIHVLTEPDLLESFRLLYYLQNGKNDPKTGKPIRLDDVEHLNLENRRVEHIGELLVNQLRKGMQRIERIIKEKMMQPTANKEAPKTLIHIKPLQGTIKEFFGSSKMSQLMDNANPLTSLTHKRRLSAMGPKGIPREAAKFDFRDVHFSHYGRICPIESPEGQNIGLISSMSTFARINSLGFLETPFYKVEKPGQVVIEPPKTFDITPDATLAEIKEKLLNNQLTSDLSIDGFTVTDDSLNTILGLTCNEDIRLTDNTVLIEKGTKVTLEDIRLIKEALDKNSQDSEQISIEIDSWTDKAKDNLDFEQISRAFNKPPILLITKETTIVDEDCYGILEQVKRHKATVTAYIKVLFETTLIVHDKLNKDFYLDLIVNYRCVVTDDVREENGETLIPANAELTAEIFQKILSKAKKSKLFIPILAPFRVLQRPSLRRDTLGEFQTLNKYVQWQSADQEVPYNIAPSTIKLNSDWELIEDTVYIRKGDNFERVNCDEVDFVEVSPAQFISVTTSLIPFLEHDDANRALMGSNMQRQAVPLLHTEAPLVGTGLERKVAEDSGAMLVCPSCGKVEYFDSKEIHLRKGVVYHKDTFEILDIPRLQDLQAEEIINEENFNHYYTRPSYLKQHLRDLPQSKRGVRLLKKPDRLELIRLRKYKRSNQGTLINHRIRVSKDQILVKGELVADASSTHHGELALGRNVIVAFMPWRGYNYEDAILVSEKLIHNDAYTSLHIEKHECEARPTKLGPERITNEITGISEDYIRNRLDSRGIILVGAEVKAGDILVGKTTPKGESDLTGEEKLIRAVFGDKGKGHKNTSLKVPHGEDGVVIETQYFSREQGDELPNSIHELVRVYIAKKRTLKVGDKMAGRHGNKGVVSRILPVEDMPFLPDGTPVDIVLNPLGVPSRMNIGQVLETHLGLACAMIPEAHAEDYQELIKDEKPISFDRSKRTHELVIDFDNLELLKSCKVLKDIELNILKKDTVINRNDIIQIQELLHLGSIDVDDLFSRLSECVRYTRDDNTIPDLFVGGTAINDIIKPEIAIKKGTVLQIENLDDIIKPYLEDKTITVDDLEVAFGCKVDVKNLGELLKRRALSDIYRREKILRKGDVVTAQHIESIKSAVEAGLIDVRTAIDSMEVSITPNNIDKMLGGIVKKDIKTIVSKKDSVVREDDIKLFRDKVKEDHTFLDVLKSSISINIDRTYYKPARKPLRIGSPVFESISEDTIRMLYKKLNLPLDGKSVLFDGLSGDPFIERVMVGVMYFMKLNHLVDDKMHARSTGSYALITQQPLGGKAQFGGQRLGEMEVWALEGYGAAYLLKEMLTVKSDDIDGRNKTYKAIVEGNIIPEPGIPESFNVMINELKTLCLDVSVYDENNEIIDLSEFDEEDRSKVVRVYDENIDTDVFLDPSLEDDMPDMVMAPGKRTRRPRTKE